MKNFIKREICEINNIPTHMSSSSNSCRIRLEKWIKTSCKCIGSCADHGQIKRGETNLKTLNFYGSKSETKTVRLKKPKERIRQFRKKMVKIIF